jgi:hypothetical protein
MKYAGDINNNYAIAVFYVLQITCLYGLGDHKRAQELLSNSKEHGSNSQLPVLAIQPC